MLTATSEAHGAIALAESSWLSGATQRDDKRPGLATTLYGTVARSFVIPSVDGPEAYLSG